MSLTKAAIAKAFEKLDTVDQANLLGQLATAFSQSLEEIDRRDAQVFDARRTEESRASPIRDVKRRLGMARHSRRMRK
jgi:hypothetical protein